MHTGIIMYRQRLINTHGRLFATIHLLSRCRETATIICCVHVVMPVVYEEAADRRPGFLLLPFTGDRVFMWLNHGYWQGPTGMMRLVIRRHAVVVAA